MDSSTLGGACEKSLGLQRWKCVCCLQVFFLAGWDAVVYSLNVSWWYFQKFSIKHHQTMMYIYMYNHGFRKLLQGLHRLGYTEDRGCEFHRSLMKSLVAIVVKRVLRDPFTRMPVLSSARWTPTRQGFWPWRAQASTIKDNGFFIENGQGLSNLLQGSLHGLHRLQNCSFHHVHTYSSNKSVVFRSIFLWLCWSSLMQFVYFVWSLTWS